MASAPSAPRCAASACVRPLIDSARFDEEETLPEEIRLPDYMEDGKKPTPYDIVWNVFVNWEHISVELAVETWINEWLEDGAYGRLDAGKPLNQLTGQITGGSRATAAPLPVPEIDIDVENYKVRLIWPEGPDV